MLATSFDWVAGYDARILILGSMPGRESLRQQQYYAHPRNAFWPIMGRLFGFDPALPYPSRLNELKRHRIALWDVAHRCIRPGSLDADIRDAEPNDLEGFFQGHPSIVSIFFNGTKAWQMYRKLILPGLARPWRDLPGLRLPSTSPAHAAMRFEDKLAAWSIVREGLESGNP